MKKRKTGFSLHRLLCWLMAIHLLNISVSTPDHYYPPTHLGGQREDLSVNKIESFGELVLEHWLGYTDAVPENDESDDESDLSPVEQDYFFEQPFVFALVPSSWHLTAHPVLFKPSRVLSHFLEITLPPPQA